MNTIIDESAGLNLHGVEMMAAGEDRKARDLFMDAIRKTAALMDRNITASKISGQTHTLTTEKNQNILPANSKFNSKRNQKERSSDPTNYSKPHSSRSFPFPCKFTEFELRRMKSGDAFYLYNQAIIFHPTPLPENKPDIANVDLTFYTAAIMFNLALCHHMKGIQTGKNTLLRKARVLYRKCSQLMKQYLEVVGGAHFLLLAVCNNQAHICYELTDATSFHGHISEVKKYISKRSHMLTTKNEFFLNVLISPQLFCTAPLA